MIARFLVAGVALLTVAACTGSGDEVRDGLYLGDRVTFRVVDGRATEFRLSGLECRVPHPDNELLALCLERAPGLPTGSLGIEDAAFSGTLEQVVVLTGRFAGDAASGTWRFTTTCIGEQVCAGAGEWSAAYKQQITPPDPDVPAPDGGVDAVGDLPPDGGGPDVLAPDADPPPLTASEIQKQAHDLISDLRASCGVAAAAQEADINAAAQAHADYYGLHASKYQSAGLSAHREDPDWEEGFTGVSFGDRLAFQGVSSGGYSSEIMAFVSTPAAAIEGWLETLYHRIPLIHPSMIRYGYGGSTTGAACQVADLIYGAAALPGPARWPLPGATGVYAIWYGGESPQPPLDAPNSYPSGPIVTITFPRNTPMSLARAELTGPGGEPVPSQVQTPDNDSNLQTTWALYPYDPLESGQTYTVLFEGSVSGEALSDSWSFTTR